MLSVVNSANRELRTGILNKRIAQITKDLGILQILKQDLNEDSQQLKDYAGELQYELSTLAQYRDSFNSTFWDTDRVNSITQKLQSVKKLLDIWEFRMFKLVSKKKNILNEVYYLAQRMAETIQ